MEPGGRGWSPGPGVEPGDRGWSPGAGGGAVLRSQVAEGGGPNRGHVAHQVPLKNPISDDGELKKLEDWLKSYKFNELFNKEKGFTL